MTTHTHTHTQEISITLDFYIGHVILLLILVFVHCGFFIFRKGKTIHNY